MALNPGCILAWWWDLKIISAWAIPRLVGSELLGVDENGGLGYWVWKGLVIIITTLNSLYRKRLLASLRALNWDEETACLHSFSPTFPCEYQYICTKQLTSVRICGLWKQLDWARIKSRSLLVLAKNAKLHQSVKDVPKRFIKNSCSLPRVVCFREVFRPDLQIISLVHLLCDMFSSSRGEYLIQA